MGSWIVAWAAGVGCGLFAAFIFPHAQTAGFDGTTHPVPVGEAEDLPSEREPSWGPLVPLPVREILLRDPSAAEEGSFPALFRYLDQLAGMDALPREGFPEADVRWIADGVMGWMRRACPDSEPLARGLLRIARLAEPASAVKECALTHLGRCRMSPRAREEFSREIAELAGNDPQFPWVGIALGLLGGEVFPAERPEWVRERCLKLIADSHAHVLCRIGALSLAANRHWKDAEPLARVQSVSSASLAERVAALHVLAEVGDEETFLWLEKWDVPQDPFLAACWEETRSCLGGRR
jgi:hypothetical protein